MSRYDMNAEDMFSMQQSKSLIARVRYCLAYRVNTMSVHLFAVAQCQKVEVSHL